MLQLLTTIKCRRTYLFHALRKNDFSETTAPKALYSNFLESIWKLSGRNTFVALTCIEFNVLEFVIDDHFRKIIAILECAFSECFQSTSFLKYYFFQIFAPQKCIVLNFFNHLRDGYAFYLSPLKAGRPNLL